MNPLREMFEHLWLVQNQLQRRFKPQHSDSLTRMNANLLLAPPLSEESVLGSDVFLALAGWFDRIGPVLGLSLGSSNRNR